jgi:thiol-disulfide isomerase/thioredoxin
MYDGRPYHNGFLDFAYEDSLSLEYLNPIENSITWKGDVTKENVFVIAAVFNPQVNIGYAYPPSSKPFDAYYIDACAKASPDKTGHNIRTNDITHTVFIEEGTGSWCKNCPSMADVLYNISKENEISFYYAAMIEDMNQIANNRMRNQLNIYGFPTVYIDGGKKVLMGGNPNVSYLKSLIEECATSDVHDLNLNLSVKWIGDGELRITYNITSLEEIEEQLVKINKIRGGKKKVWIIVENIGEVDMSNVNWKIIVKGGIFDRINHTTEGQIKDFPSGVKKIIRTKSRLFQIYGYGRIEVIIQAGSTISIESGIILGKYVFINN